VGKENGWDLKETGQFFEVYCSQIDFLYLGLKLQILKKISNIKEMKF
jgi:hypothetical protein